MAPKIDLQKMINVSEAIDYTKGKILATLAMLPFLCSLCMATPSPPDWVRNLGLSPGYPDAEYLTGFGVSEASFAEAEEKARNNLAQRIEVLVEGEQEFEIQETEGLIEKEVFTERMRSQHRVVLQGLRYLRYQGKEQYFAFAILERSRATETYQAHLTRQMENIQEMFNKAGAWSDSVKWMVRAAIVVEKAWPDAQLLQSLSRNRRTLDSLHVLRSRVADQFQELVDGLQLTGHAPTQMGVWGKRLEEPLEVEVRQGNRPVDGVPVEFFFTRGNGQLGGRDGGSGSRIEVLTNIEGKAFCQVDQVRSISRDNQIRAQIDVFRFAAEADAGARRLLARWKNRPTKQFHFSSRLFTRQIDLLTVFLNGSADEQVFEEGERVSCEIHLPVSASVFLLQIDAGGTMEIARQLEVKGEDGGPGWEVTRGGNSLVLKYESEAAALQGSGLETLLAVALPLGSALPFPPGGFHQEEELWRAIAEVVEGKPWSAGWVTYEIRAKKEAGG
jgi:hypothetical protein